MLIYRQLQIVINIDNIIVINSYFYPVFNPKILVT
nr:MAG TPA: hypothetical protein [Caudoviricetes sp.]